MRRRECSSMLSIRKCACYAVAVCLALVLSLSSYAEAANESIGKETAVKREAPAKEPAAASQDRPSKERQLIGEAAKKEAAAKEKKDEVAQENQDQDIMEQALALIDASQEYWVKGDVENALEMLDQAYALILDTNGEPDIARQKDDLRLPYFQENPCRLQRHASDNPRYTKRNPLNDQFRRGKGNPVFPGI